MVERYEKILVAVDGSDAAKLALEKAIEITKRNNGSLFICHVIDTRSFVTVDQYDQTIVNRSEVKAQELLKSYQLIAEKRGVANVTTVIDYGSPKVKVSKDIAINHEIDLIVTGATGLNAIERFLIGSVSESIARHAKCDVLIVRDSN
ncbi:universal stress protein [Bacillus alkalicellulosilyticus]|uniref:universal stress protein n=1 Tax=Alkalihalobacterium alkalicellulosilyticum TaxID=1912214 RepID=UPI000998A89C|nr:universal stress protein [Bacillus alkalicellulosilyticus]